MQKIIKPWMAQVFYDESKTPAAVSFHYTQEEAEEWADRQIELDPEAVCTIGDLRTVGRRAEPSVWIPRLLTLAAIFTVLWLALIDAWYILAPLAIGTAAWTAFSGTRRRHVANDH